MSYRAASAQHKSVYLTVLRSDVMFYLYCLNSRCL